MTKYDPLRDHLLLQRTEELTLDFGAVERLLGQSLPKSAVRPQWWANVRDKDTSHAQRRAWRDAGYEAFSVPIEPVSCSAA